MRNWNRQKDVLQTVVKDGDASFPKTMPSLKGKMSRDTATVAAGLTQPIALISISAAQFYANLSHVFLEDYAGKLFSLKEDRH